MAREISFVDLDDGEIQVVAIVDENSTEIEIGHIEQQSAGSWEICWQIDDLEPTVHVTREEAEACALETLGATREQS